MINSLSPIRPVSALNFNVQQLSAGQVVRLTVVEPGINGGIVSLGGALFRAQGQLPSEPGQAFWALVERATPELIHVRQLPSRQTQQGPPTPSNLASLIGLPKGADTDLVIRAFLRWGLPIDPQAVRDLLAEMKNVPQHLRTVWIEARVWLSGLNWPRESAAGATGLPGQQELAQGREQEGAVYLKAGTQENMDGRVAVGDRMARAMDYLLGRENAGPEGLQALNRAEAPAGQGQVFAAHLNAMPFFEGRVFWLDEPVKQANGKERPARVVLHVRSNTLGDLWVDLEFNERGLNAGVYLQDEKTAGLARRWAPVLEEQLKALGLELQRVAVEQRDIRSPLGLLLPGEVSYEPINERA
ncbi:hypothetical protein ACP3TJ_06655 [Desulforudis sp. 1088]|uniref:hypothetical protein n=1 Tax=unclassified Candidatus Desulforudis TaxID=2635950 RepID=UPI003CE4F9F2